MGKRIVAAVSAGYEVDGRQEWADQGEEVDFTPEDEARLEKARALVPKGKTLEVHLQESMDRFRGGRSDPHAAARLGDARSGSIENIDEPSDSIREMARIIREQRPTADETVGLADGDPVKAKVVLEGEKIVTGNNPRAGVAKALTKLIAEG